MDDRLQWKFQTMENQDGMGRQAENATQYYRFHGPLRNHSIDPHLALLMRANKLLAKNVTFLQYILPFCELLTKEGLLRCHQPDQIILISK